jgi:hypothetical protein
MMYMLPTLFSFVMLSGTCGHGGYLACQQCKIKGTIGATSNTRRRRGTNKKKGMRYVHGYAGVPERRTNAEWASYLTEERPGVPVEPGKGHIRNIDTPFHTRLGLKMASN